MPPSRFTTSAAAALSSRALAVFRASLSGVEVVQMMRADGYRARISFSAASNPFAQSSVGVPSEWRPLLK